MSFSARFTVQEAILFYALKPHCWLVSITLCEITYSIWNIRSVVFHITALVVSRPRRSAPTNTRLSASQAASRRSPSQVNIKWHSCPHTQWNQHRIGSFQSHLILNSLEQQLGSFLNGGETVGTFTVTKAFKDLLLFRSSSFVSCRRNKPWRTYGTCPCMFLYRRKTIVKEVTGLSNFIQRPSLKELNYWGPSKSTWYKIIRLSLK